MIILVISGFLSAVSLLTKTNTLYNRISGAVAIASVVVNALTDFFSTFCKQKKKELVENKEMGEESEVGLKFAKIHNAKF